MSHSRDIQQLSTGFHALCVEWGCRVWLEWVPSKSNPADILSRGHRSEEFIKKLYDLNSAHYEEMVLPKWVDQHAFVRIDKILEEVKSP